VPSLGGHLGEPDTSDEHGTARAEGRADIARHVTGCNVTQETPFSETYLFDNFNGKWIQRTTGNRHTRPGGVAIPRNAEGGRTLIVENACVHDIGSNLCLALELNGIL
jgi:hypothetical protein